MRETPNKTLNTEICHLNYMVKSLMVGTTRREVVTNPSETTRRISILDKDIVRSFWKQKESILKIDSLDTQKFHDNDYFMNERDNNQEQVNSRQDSSLPDLIEDIRFVATLFDGEGCLFLHQPKGKKSGPRQVRFYLKLNMGCPIAPYELQRALRRLTNGEVYCGLKPRAKDEAKIQWIVNVYEKHTCYEILIKLYPFFMTKKVEATMALEYLSNAIKVDSYKATDRDLQLTEVATRIRQGCSKAYLEAFNLIDLRYNDQIMERASYAADNCWCKLCKKGAAL